MKKSTAFKSDSKTTSVTEHKIVLEQLETNSFFVTYIDEAGKKCKSRITGRSHHWFDTKNEAVKWLLDYNEHRIDILTKSIELCRERIQKIKNL